MTTHSSLTADPARRHKRPEMDIRSLANCSGKATNASRIEDPSHEYGQIHHKRQTNNYTSPKKTTFAATSN